MALVQEEYLYEVLARFTPAGLSGCHKIVNTRIVDTDTEAVLSDSLGSAVAISAEEAADLILSATPVTSQQSVDVPASKAEG